MIYRANELNKELDIEWKNEPVSADWNKLSKNTQEILKKWFPITSKDKEEDRGEKQEISILKKKSQELTGKILHEKTNCFLKI